MNYTRFLSAVGAARTPSPIRELTALLAKSPPTMISLAAGAPNPAMFPFKELTIKISDGHVIHLAGREMQTALQYLPTPGHPPLVHQLESMQKRFHGSSINSQSPQWSVSVVAGCQEALCKSFEALVSPGDPVIVDNPAFPGALQVLKPMGAKFVPVNTDGQGLVPENLNSALEKWKNDRNNAPKVMYTVPNGCNPTGASTTLTRKKEIYKLAQEYDIIIMEDDPYYFLQFGEEKIPSYLSLDSDGRVLRFDSFSKILSAGMRIGVLTGPAPLVSCLNMHISVASVHANAMSQILLENLFTHWGETGFDQHVDSVVAFYLAQRDAALKSADRWLSGLAEWTVPQAGMFLWIRVNGVPDMGKVLRENALQKQVLFVPGDVFFPEDLTSPFVRAAFSLSSPDMMDMGLQRLSEMIQSELERCSK